MEIIAYPHPTLRHKSRPIQRIDAELVSIVRQMFSLMYAAKGIGLAANQVNLPLRLFIVNLEAEPTKGQELVFINPVLSHMKGNEEKEEGCLSVPGVYGNVNRPKQVRVQAYDLKGNEISATVEGLLSRCIQHETDHLDGMLFFDRMSPMSRADLRIELEEFETVFNNRRSIGEIPVDEELSKQLEIWEKRYCT